MALEKKIVVTVIELEFAKPVPLLFFFKSAPMLSFSYALSN